MSNLRGSDYMSMVMTETRDNDPAPAPAPPATETKPAPRLPKEVGGPKGPEPTRYGDWERKGRVSDF